MISWRGEPNKLQDHPGLFPTDVTIQQIHAMSLPAAAWCCNQYALLSPSFKVDCCIFTAESRKMEWKRWDHESSMWKMKEYNELTLFYLQMRFCSTVMNRDGKVGDRSWQAQIWPCSSPRIVVIPRWRQSKQVISRERENSGFSITLGSKHSAISAWLWGWQRLFWNEKRSNISWDIANRVRSLLVAMVALYFLMGMIGD